MTIRSLSVLFGYLAVAGILASAQANGPVPDGIFTQAQVVRGAVLYGEYCASCHRENLQGAGITPPFPNGPTRMPALNDATFQANYNGMTLGDLFERIRISMPQNKPGSLSRRENADILAFLLSQNGVLPGNEQLPDSKEALAAWRIERAPR